VKVRTCRWCRKLYQGLSDTFCPECVEKMDDAFVTIRTYLDDHPKANAAEVTKATGLEERVVLQLLKDERLQEYTHLTKRCEICGRTITEGRFCGGCKKMMRSVLEDKSPARNVGRNQQGHAHYDKNAKSDPQMKPFRDIRMYDD